MIKLNVSRLTDFLPDSLASEPEIQAFSYAVGRQIEKLCNYADAARMYSAIDDLPDKILDVLAVELRTPAYLESYPTATKRTLIKGTMIFYLQLGTKAAINKIIGSIFGSGATWEWWEYDGSPYHFKVVTTADVSGEQYDRFIQALNAVKNVRSILDEVIIALKGTWNYYYYVKQKTWEDMAGMTWDEAAAGN